MIMDDKKSDENVEGETSEKKSIVDILNMEGNDELKFGVLISLIKLKQVSTKDVINIILNLVCISVILENVKHNISFSDFIIHTDSLQIIIHIQII